MDMPHIDLPLLPPFLSFSNFTKRNNIHLARKRTQKGLMAISSSFSSNQNVKDRIKVRKVKSKLSSNVIDLDKNDEVKIPLRKMMARVSIPTPLSFYEPRLELRDEDVKDKNFQLDEGRLNPCQVHELVGEEDINIDCFDDNEKEVKEGDGEKDKEEGDQKV